MAVLLESLYGFARSRPVPVRFHLTRLSFTGLLSGKDCPSRLRSRDCKVMVSASTGVRTNVPVAFCPVGSTSDVLTVHRSPSRDQAPSPNAPDSSKLHERIRC